VKKLIALSAFAACALQGSAQLVVGNDQTDPTIWFVDVSNGSATALLNAASAETDGLAYDQLNNILYWCSGDTLYSATFSLSGITPNTPVTITNSVNSNAIRMHGLAWDFFEAKLVGYCPDGTPTYRAFFEIDPSTGVATKIQQPSSAINFGGVDFDPDTNRIYGTNVQGTGGNPLSGSGIYQSFAFWGNPYGYSKITDFPNGESDIDGLAVGEGYIYLVNDAHLTGAAQDIHVWDMTNSTYLSDISTPFTDTDATSCGATFVRCLSDVNHDNVVDSEDYFQFFNDYDNSAAAADLDRSSEVDLADFFYFLDHYDLGC